MPSATEYLCREIRLNVSEEMHQWIKEASGKRGAPVATFVRDVLEAEMERPVREAACRRTDRFIEFIARRVVLMDAMAEKLGVEIPESQPDFEGGNSTEKEG